MRGKLEANGDHMPTDRQQMVYVQSQVGGLAMKHIQSQLRADAIIQFVTAQEMFDHLEAIFGDPNWKLNSRNKYQSLRQGDCDFNTFWAEFQLLSADFDHNKATLIDNLVYKFYHIIQRQLVTGDKLPTSFWEVALRCQQIYQSLKDADWNKAAYKRYNKPKPTLNGNKAATSTTTATPITNAPTFVQQMAQPYTGDPAWKLSTEEMDQCRMERQCFNCK